MDFDAWNLVVHDIRRGDARQFRIWCKVACTPYRPRLVDARGMFQKVSGVESVKDNLSTGV